MIPHHGSSEAGSQVWTDVVIKNNMFTLVAAIVSVGQYSQHGHPAPFLHTKFWPFSMLGVEHDVLSLWAVNKRRKDSGSRFKQTKKKMRARVLITGLARDILDFVFTKKGSLYFLNEIDKAIKYEAIIHEKIVTSLEIAFNKKEKKFIFQMPSSLLPQTILEQAHPMSEDSDDCEGNIGEMENDVMSFDLDNEVVMHIINEDFNQAEENMSNVHNDIQNAGYRIQNVPGDGNCAFTSVQVARGNEVFTGNNQPLQELSQAQQTQIQALRNDTADLISKNENDEITTEFINNLRQLDFWNSGIEGGVGIEILSFVAQVIGQPILVLTQEPNGNYRYWISGTMEKPRDGNLIFHEIAVNEIGQALNKYPNAIKLFHNGIHFQALVPNS